MASIDLIDWWPSPAKINLFLHVCGRYPNGYHELETMFQLLDSGDQIGFVLNQSGQITIAKPILGVSTEDNLVYKAAKLLLPFRPNNDLGVDLHIDKHLPMGGGLGGGSSNAATVILALNYLWKCNLPQDQLLALGLSLGADVPVFINGCSAFAKGVGEKLSNVHIPTFYYLVATPSVHISTAEVFSHPDLPRNTLKINFADRDVPDLLAKVFTSTQNDCEKLVCKQHPEVANLLQWLLHYAPSRMTGTGASVFAQFERLEDAKSVLERIPDDVTAFVAKGIDQSPLHEKLAQVHAKDQLL